MLITEIEHFLGLGNDSVFDPRVFTWNILVSCIASPGG